MRFTDPVLRKVQEAYNKMMYAYQRRMHIVFSGHDLPSQKPRMLHRKGYNAIRAFGKALDKRVTVSGVTNTKSMDPMIDKGHVILVGDKPGQRSLQVGDVILFHRKLDKNPRVLHRIIEIGKDEDGWYCITRGDNTVWIDGKIRYKEISGILVAVVY